MSLVSLIKQAKMSFVPLSFNEKVGESGESQKTRKMSFVYVSFKRQVDESGEFQKTSKNEFLYEVSVMY